MSVLAVLLLLGLVSVGWLAYDQYERAQSSGAALSRLSGELDSQREEAQQMRAEADSLLGQVNGLNGEVDALTGSLSASQREAEELRQARTVCTEAIATGERLLAGTEEFIEAMSTGNGLRAQYVLADLEPLWAAWDEQSAACRGGEGGAPLDGSRGESGRPGSEGAASRDGETSEQASGESWWERTLPDWFGFG